jgi:hypothetical protein
MQTNQQKSIYEDRKTEVLEELSKLSEYELRSFALDKSSLAIVDMVLQYKKSKTDKQSEMVINKQEIIYQNRETEILEELSKLSEWELRTLAIDESSLAAVNAVLKYKESKNCMKNEIGSAKILSQHN